MIDFLIAAIPMVASGSVAHAGDVDAVWAHYADHLPQFCRYTVLLPDNKTWGDHGAPLATTRFAPLYGAAWEHLHHYCFALEDIYQATSTDDAEVRKAMFTRAVSECDYVLERSPTDMPLRPEILFNRATALLNLGRNLEAVGNLSDALALNPNFVPAYIALSDYFRNLGDRDEAIRLVRLGLEHVPDSESLRSRASDLGSGIDSPPTDTNRP